jgi:hypothetical protein
MAQQGLLHRKRKCPACFVTDMQLLYMQDVENQYIWKCSFCFYVCSINKSTVLTAVNIRHFDVSLTMWMMNCKTVNASRMITEKGKFMASNAWAYFTLFRKAHSFWVAKYVLPYLVLTGPIEIDESKVNHKKYHCQGNMTMIRWMFGMFCRRTKIQVIYSIKEKSMANIFPLMKQHCEQGTMVFSDSHMGYCNLNNGTSRLT